MDVGSAVDLHIITMRLRYFSLLLVVATTVLVIPTLEATMGIIGAQDLSPRARTN